MYQMQTTFWLDFTIADRFGVEGVKDTYKRAFSEWKTDYIYLTELAIVTNWKCWQHYEKGNMELSELYSEYYYKTRSYALNHLKGDELKYYLKTTD